LTCRSPFLFSAVGLDTEEAGEREEEEGNALREYHSSVPFKQRNIHPLAFERLEYNLTIFVFYP